MHCVPKFLFSYTYGWWCVLLLPGLNGSTCPQETIHSVQLAPVSPCFYMLTLNIIRTSLPRFSKRFFRSGIPNKILNAFLIFCMHVPTITLITLGKE